MPTLDECFKYFESGDWEMTIDCLTQAIERNPNDAKAFYRRGTAKAKLRRYESAFSDFDQAIKLDPNDATAFSNRGATKFELRRYESAFSDFDRAIELDPNFALAFFNRGAAKVELHRYESALSDFDLAIKLDPNFAPAFYIRGAAKFELRRYESAFSDFDRAIELAPEMSLPFFGKAQTLWIGLDDPGAAHFHFNRFIFLAEAEKIIKSWKTTHDFYAHHAAVPFLLHRLFELLPGIGDFHSWQGTLHETERQCRTLKNYLQHLRHPDVASGRDAPQFRRLEALVHYFMGDPMEAYRIYGEILDEEPECLDLMDSYYFLCSALEFLEPCEGIWIFALQQADQLLGSARTEGDERERYYAGQLYALGDDWEKAFEAFGRAEAFFPAALMQAVAADHLDMPEEDSEALWEKARQLADAPEVSGQALPPEVFWIDGFPAVHLELGRKDYLEPFRQYAHFREIAEHLHLVRDNSAPFHAADFWEIWQLSPADEQEISWQLRKRELELIEDELQSFFTQNLEAQYADYTPEQLQNLEKLLSEKDKAVQSVFEKLKTKSASGSEALEHQFGLEIDGWQLRQPHTYSLMLKYFFLSEKLAPKATFYLYFYNDFKASEKQKVYSSGKAAYTKGAQKFLEIILKPVWMLGDVGLAAVAAALAELSRQFFLQNPAELDEADVTSNYQKFKAGFLKFLSFERESMGEEKFFQKYPLEGWEDWKK